MKYAWYGFGILFSVILRCLDEIFIWHFVFSPLLVVLCSFWMRVFLEGELATVPGIGTVVL